MYLISLETPPSNGPYTNGGAFCRISRVYVYMCSMVRRTEVEAGLASGIQDCLTVTVGGPSWTKLMERRA
jgi:hypothetical protein